MSQTWLNNQRLRSAGLSDSQIAELRAGLATGETRKYVAKTDEAGTGFFRISDNGADDITVGGAPTSIDRL